MAYRLVQPHPPDVLEQIQALPAHARACFDDALDAILELPWDARPLNYANPTGLRVGPFADGFGAIVFQVLGFEAGPGRTSHVARLIEALPGHGL